MNLKGNEGDDVRLLKTAERCLLPGNDFPDDIGHNELEHRKRKNLEGLLLMAS